MTNTKQTLLIKVAAQHPAPAFLSDLCTALAMTKVARMAAIQGFTEDYLMNKKADLNEALGNAWKGVQDWWADDNNKAGLIGGGLGALGTYGLTGLVPGLRGNTAARLGLSGLAGVGGWYGGRYGAQQLMDKYLNKGKEEAFGPAFQQGLDQASNEAADTAKEVSERHAAETQDLQNQITSLTDKLNAQQQAAAKRQQEAANVADQRSQYEQYYRDIAAQEAAEKQQNLQNQLADSLGLLKATDRYQQGITSDLSSAYNEIDALKQQLGSANAATATAKAMAQKKLKAQQNKADKQLRDAQAAANAAAIAAQEREGQQHYIADRDRVIKETLEQQLANVYNDPRVVAAPTPPKEEAEPKYDMAAAGGANSGLHERSAANAVKPEFLPEVKIDRLADSYIKAMKPSIFDRLTGNGTPEKRLNAATNLIDMYNKALTTDPAYAQELAPYIPQARQIRQRLLLGK